MEEPPPLGHHGGSCGLPKARRNGTNGRNKDRTVSDNRGIESSSESLASRFIN